MNGNDVIHFDSFGVEHVPKEIKRCIGNKNIITKIFGMQTDNSTMCEYFWIGFINFMQKDKSLIYYNNIFSPNECKKNDKIILK